MESMNRFEYCCFFQTRHSLDDVFIRDRLYRNGVRAASTRIIDSDREYACCPFSYM